MTAIDVQGLVMRYDDFTAVDGVDLHVEEGEILAFLGPNGAGKTSTCLLYTSPSPRDRTRSRMPSSA